MVDGDLVARKEKGFRGFDTTTCSEKKRQGRDAEGEGERNSEERMEFP